MIFNTQCRLFAKLALLFAITYSSLLISSSSAQSVEIYEPFPEVFTNPLGLEYAVNIPSKIYIVERIGIIKELDIEDKEKGSVEWLDISERINPVGEQGLLGLTFHPNFPENNTFYLNYTIVGEDETIYTRISRFRAPDGMASVESEEILMEIEQPQDNHNGGQLTFGPDGYLYIALGDGGRDSRFNSQDTQNIYGNILRIDVNVSEGYQIPDDNPFVGDENGLDEIYAWGFRNPWRMSFDPVTGYLWVADVGQTEWESIYIVEKGKNYGWPIVEGSHCYAADTCDKTGLEMPLFEYPWGQDDTGRSVTGGYVYRGSANPSLFGKYIYGDFISGRIWALEVDHDEKEVISNEELILTDYRIPSFGIDSNGEIYILRFQGSFSRIYRFVAEETNGVLDPPGAVELLSPEDGAMGVSVDPVLSWEAEPQASSYRLQVAASGDFTSTVVDEAGLEETEFGVTGLDYETTYFWRVQASNDAGDGEWSEVWSFATEEEPLVPPGVVVLVSPEDEAVDVSVDPVLNWEAVEQGAGYRVQVSLSGDFESMVVDEAGIEETEFEVSDLDYETTYFWRVLATNEAGDGDWSEVWSFTTEEEPLVPPGIVALISPEDGAVDVSVDPVLSWEAVEQGTGYRVQVALDSEFGDLVVDEDGVTVTELEVSGLDFETTYFWRVLASNDAGDGEWSEVWSFATEEEPLVPPGVVVLVSPEDEATDVVVDPVLSWEAESQAASYRLQVSASGDFESTVVDEVGIEETELEVLGLDYETTYFWRARASNDAGDGDWSEIWSFVTEDEPLSPPGVVTLISPEDGAVDVSVNPVLSWEAVDQGAGYRVQVSLSGDFESTVVDEAGLEETEFEVTGLDFETTNFWRVLASNEAGDGDWSEIWSFMTESEPQEPVVSSLVLRVEGDVITIEWETEAAGLVDFFRIYRGPDPQELNEVAVMGAGELSFSESGQTGVTVFYAVSAVSNSGSESELSEPVSFFTGEAEIDAGWSMISIPTPVEGLSAEGAILYGFDGVYRNEELLKAGMGYWAKSSGSSAVQIPFSGSGMVSEEMELNRGWNLIGSLAAGLSVSEIEDPDGILTAAPVYEYDGTVYGEADMMQPGAGYWIYAGNDGTVELRLRAGKADAGKYDEPLAEEITGRLTFRYQSHSAELKLSDMPFSAAEKYRFLMPPMAPGPSLDVRTEDGFRIVDQQFQRISLHSPGYPLTIEAETQPGQQGAFYRLKGREESGTAVEFDLMPGRIITISSELSDLRLERLSSEELITTTRLDPGYPNPFNPSTNIRYRLADAANVELEVFDMTGRRVATLVNERQQAGSYTVQFDATALASGIYLVTLRADGLLRTQKVTLVK